MGLIITALVTFLASAVANALNQHAIGLFLRVISTVCMIATGISLFTLKAGRWFVMLNKIDSGYVPLQGGHYEIVHIAKLYGVRDYNVSALCDILRGRLRHIAIQIEAVSDSTEFATMYFAPKKVAAGTTPADLLKEILDAIEEIRCDVIGAKKQHDLLSVMSEDDWHKHKS